MIKFDLEFSGGDEIVEKTSDYSRKVLFKSMLKMEELAIRFAPADTSYLRERITLFPQLLADEYTLSANAPHSEPTEYGTRPFYAPIAPLIKWASRKLGDEKLGYAVRASIAKEGIKAQPYMRPALFQVKDFWVKKFAEESNI